MTLTELAAEYRPSMDNVILHSWAQDVLAAIKALAPKEDGWIEWVGGECPVPRGARVDIQFSKGETILNTDTDWHWHCGIDPIIAYRLAK